MDAPVVIVGAGPVGLSLALGLSCQGVPCLVLERKEALSPHSRAPAIHARTLEIFGSWGVAEPMLQAGTFLRDVHLWLVGHTEPVAHVDLGVLARETAYPGLLVLPQDRTEALLLDEVRRRGLAEVRFGHALQGFRQDDEWVTVRVVPADGDPYEVSTHFLVGCDGAHSTVREQLGWQLEGKTYPSRLMLADVRLPDARNDLPWPRAQVTDEVFQFALRIEAHLWRIIGLVPPGCSEAGAVTEAAIAARVAGLFGAGPFELVWASPFHIHCRTSPHFRLGRVLLAGDAAHLNSPAGGQGMNSGIQDAHNLAWKLARAVQGGACDALLASYEQERRPAILRSVDRFTDLLTRAILLTGPRARTVVARLARALLERAALTARLAPRVAMLDVSYGPSDLLSGAGAMLGSRAPDGALVDVSGNRLRLYDMLGREAVLLLFDDGRLPRWDTDATSRALRHVPNLQVVRLLETTVPAESGDLRDAHGDLWRRWRMNGGTAVLVRPDGIVGWRAERPDEHELRRHVATALGARLD